MSPAVRGSVEPRFGWDFGAVRIHTGSAAEEAASTLQARAFTIGPNIAFGPGEYSPGTPRGERLLAHELTHVVQQAEGRADSQTIRRQPADQWTNFKRQLQGGSYVPPATSGPSSRLPQPYVPPVGHTESAHKASYRIRVVAHASPRWRAASDAKDAERNNLALSVRRAQSVGREVQNRLAKFMPAGSTTRVEASGDLREGTVGITEEAHGSRDTLKEAHGNRKDNAQARRRVDIYISTNQDIEGEAAGSKPFVKGSNASNFWHVGVSVSASGGVGVGPSAAFLAVALTNDMTGETMTAHVLGIQDGLAGPFIASATISFSDAKGFSTRYPKNFKDFQNTPFLYSNASIDLFAGYAYSKIELPGMGTDPSVIDASGAIAGVPGADISQLVGYLSFDSSTYSPTEYDIENSDQTVSSYNRAEKGEQAYTVYLDTKQDTLDEKHDATELLLLDEFLKSVVAAQR